MRRKRRTSIVVKAALLCFAMYAVVTLIQLQLSINQKSKELKEIENQIDAVKQENDELRESLELGTSDAYIASIATTPNGSYVLGNTATSADLYILHKSLYGS